jgi:hypothetical protein
VGQRWRRGRKIGGNGVVRTNLKRWFCSPLQGWQALVCATLALALPTVVRSAVNGVITGCEFTPYLPFVFICAVLLRWWQAGLVAFASLALLGGLFEGLPSQHLAEACFVTSAAIFLAASAGLIAFALVLQRFITGLQTPDEAAGGVVFSLDRGEVWASWYGHDYPLRLGTRRKVRTMMEDFLKQEDLARRLGFDDDDKPAR